MNQSHVLRVLIVDDEEFNRLRLRDLLHLQSAVEVVGEASNGAEAVERIRSLRPDLVFLDIRMPGQSGLEVVREVGLDLMPATIFVTAYDQHAVEAFQLAALDFLVKPFDDERFDQALKRARQRVALRDLEGMRSRLREVLGGMDEGAAGQPEREVEAGQASHAGQPGHTGSVAQGAGAEGPAGASGYLERIAVEEKGTIRPIPVSDIDYILASGPYAELVVAGRKHLVRESMQSLEERLDPGRFLRVHRSAIVRLDRVEGLRRGAGGDGELLLKGGGRLRVSRSRREALERWLGLGG